MKLPNEVSILIGVALVAALTAIAGQWPEQQAGWLPLAGAAIIGGVAKAIQVWLDSRKQPMALQGSSMWRQWLIG